MNDVTIAVVQIVCGLVALVAGGEMLVRGASGLAAVMRISPLVIGLTVVAFGTSSPELAVSLQAALAGKADLSIGNVVGSNIFNVLFILGISAMIVPLVVSSQLIRRDVPLMILASMSLLAFSWNGVLGRTSGLVFFGGLLAYVAWSVVQSRRESKAVREEFAQEFHPSKKASGAVIFQLCLIIVGLVSLGVGSHWLVGGSITVATMLGVSELIIGLTIVSVGTSLPELVTSIIAAVRGERDIAVGNVVGSNIFNILGVLGLSSLLAPNGIEVATAALRFDIPVMIAVAVACLPIFFTGHLISRWEGGLFFFSYLAYTTNLVLDAAGHEFGRTFASVMTGFVIPLTLITMAIGVYRHFRGRPRQQQ